MNKPETWAMVFMNMARALRERSKDDSSRFGAVLTDKDCRVLGVGFNGPPPQINDDKVPWGVRPDKYAFIIHAEENAILDALDKNPRERLVGSSLFVTGLPCHGCVLRAIRAGVTDLIYDDSHPLAKCVNEEPRRLTEMIVDSMKVMSGNYLKFWMLSDVLKVAK